MQQDDAPRAGDAQDCRKGRRKHLPEVNASGGQGEASLVFFVVFFFQAEDGIRDLTVTGVQTCALPILCTGASSTSSSSTCLRGPATCRSRSGSFFRAPRSSSSRRRRSSRRTSRRARRRSEERRVGKECRSRWSPYH